MVERFGCSAADTITFSVEDILPPTIVTPAQNIAIECNSTSADSLNNWLNNNGNATATDNCGNLTWSYNIDATDYGCAGTRSDTVTFTVTDDCGNSSTTSAVFNIIDTTAPSIVNMPADTTVDCINVPAASGAVTAVDSCSADVALQLSEVIIRKSIAGIKAGCEINVVITALSCDNNATALQADDTYYFDLQILSMGGGSNWSLEIGGNTVSGNYGDITTLGPFNMVDGIQHFIITDINTSSCKSYISLQPPSACD